MEIEEKQPLQSEEGVVQKEGKESQPKEPDFCLESIPHKFVCMVMIPVTR